MQPFSVGQDAFRVFQHADRDVDPVGVFHAVLRRNHTAPMNFFFFYIGKVDGNALSRLTALLIAAVYLNAPNPALFVDRIHLQNVFFMDQSRDQRAGDDGAKARHGKDAVDRQPRDRLNVPRRHFFLYHLEDTGLQFTDSCPGGGGNANDRRLFHNGACQSSPDILLHHFQPVFVHQIAFVQYENGFAHAQKFKDIQMLSCLRHDALVCSHDHQNEVHADHARHHIADEFLVSGHIHNTCPCPVLHIEPGEA